MMIELGMEGGADEGSDTGVSLLRNEPCVKLYHQAGTES